MTAMTVWARVDDTFINLDKCSSMLELGPGGKNGLQLFHGCSSTIIRVPGTEANQKPRVATHQATIAMIRNYLYERLLKTTGAVNAKPD